MTTWISAVVFLAFLGNNTPSPNASMTIISFGASYCSACRSTEPLVDQLRKEGWTVRSVDTEKDKITASRWGVREIPTLVILEDGRELDRFTGSQSYSSLRKRIHGLRGNALASPLPKEDSVRDEIVPLGNVLAPTFVDQNSLVGPNHPYSRSSLQPSPIPFEGRIVIGGRDHPLIGDNHPVHRMPNLHGASPQSPLIVLGTEKRERRNARRQSDLQLLMKGKAPIPSFPECMAATVRIRIQHPEGQSIGTGTIIQAQRDEGIVLTCGHLFREGGQSDVIRVELFREGKMIQAVARLIDYRVDDVDIGLIAFPLPIPVNGVSVLPMGMGLQEDSTVFSIGCDEGADPSRRDTIITKLNRYLGSANVEIAGAPIQGRSGGGLFDNQGRLIGVCRAADYDLDEGLYAAPEVIYSFLRKHQLSHLYDRGTSFNAEPKAMGARSPTAMR